MVWRASDETCALLTYCELERVARWLAQAWQGARVRQVVQPDALELALQLAQPARAEGGARVWLLLSCRANTGRVSQLAQKPRALKTPPALAQYLKAHLEGARLCVVALADAERQLSLRFESARTPSLTLLLSLFGARSNLYVLDAEQRVVASARALGETRRDLSLGARWSDPSGGAPPAVGDDRFRATPDAQLLAAVEAHYVAAEAQAEERALAQAVARALGRRAKKFERKLRLLEQDAEAAEEAPRWKRFGELLKPQLGALKKGQRSAELRDFESGERAVVPLDAALTPRENMELCFRRARRAEKRAQRAAREVPGALAALEAARAQATEASEASPARLRELAATPELARMLSAKNARGVAALPAREKKVWKIGKRVLPTRLVPRRFASVAGCEVWVGRNDEGNDLLTTRLARGRDLFFHLEGHAGSHVVLRAGEGEAPPEAVLDAAELALHFSKAKRARVARVHVAAIRDVSKPRGAKPGLVYVHRGRSIEVRRSAERLARLLAARVED